MEQNPALFKYLLQLADNALVLGHRLGEWCGHAPELEIDMALTNIALDQTGQARSLYQRAAEIEGKGRTEDDLAYLRDAKDFHNALIVELPNGDFADTIARQFLFDAFNFYLHQELTESKDEWLKGFARKSIKETAYHLRFSSEWVLRLGDGTKTSHEKMQAAFDKIWMFTGELTTPNQVEQQMAQSGAGARSDQIKPHYQQKIAEVISQATLQIPASTWMQSGGKDGRHTEYLGFILAEMQFIQRVYPGLEW